MPIGDEGAKRQESLIQQDKHAQELSQTAVASRALVKASPLYSAECDLVDAVATGKVDLYELDDQQLPENLRGMSAAELETYIDEVAFEREELRRRIADLSKERRLYVAEQMKAKGLDDSRAFDTAVRTALRERLAEKGYQEPER